MKVLFIALWFKSNSWSICCISGWIDSGCCSSTEHSAPELIKQKYAQEPSKTVDMTSTS